jgi:hypothetical protein
MGERGIDEAEMGKWGTWKRRPLSSRTDNLTIAKNIFNLMYPTPSWQKIEIKQLTRDYFMAEPNRLIKVLYL